MQLSKKQNEYIVNATHRWNIKSGAVRSGKSYVDMIRTSSLIRSQKQLSIRVVKIWRM